jgi:transposase
MNRVLTQVKESIEFLKEKLKKEKSPSVKQRIQALYLIASKQVTRQSHISRVLGVHRNTVSSWLKTYEENGFDVMLEIKPQPGRPTSLTAEAISGLKERLNRSEGFASYEEARQFLSEEHSIELSYSRVHKLVRYEMGAKPKSPRPSNPEKKKKK